MGLHSLKFMILSRRKRIQMKSTVCFVVVVVLCHVYFYGGVFLFCCRERTLQVVFKIVRSAADGRLGERLFCAEWNVVLLTFLKGKVVMWIWRWLDILQELFICILEKTRRILSSKLNAFTEEMWLERAKENIEECIQKMRIEYFKVLTLLFRQKLTIIKV